MKNAKQRKYIITTMIIVFVIIKSNGYAIDINNIGPDSSYDTYIFAGSTQVSQVECNEPFGTVYWYVKGPNENGLGTLEDIDNGDGTSTSSTFSHICSDGSTSGEEYEITAYVYPKTDADDQSIDWDSYTLDVWTPAEEIITTPNTLTITDDIKIGDSYAFTADVSSSHSNYLINSIEVLVNGVSVQSQSFSGVTSASMNISGFLPLSAGSQMEVELKIIVYLKPVIFAGAKFLVLKALRGALKGSVTGFAQCKDDTNALDCRNRYQYTCIENSQEVIKFRNNKTRVRWTAGNKENTGWTKNDGSYAFFNEVPYGHDITMWLQGDDLHNHNGSMLICKYEEDTNIGRVGEVVLGVLPKDGKWLVHSFLESPVATYDPCINPYPVTFNDNW